jgi:hypothetical protein
MKQGRNSTEAKRLLQIINRRMMQTQVTKAGGDGPEFLSPLA